VATEGGADAGNSHSRGTAIVEKQLKSGKLE